MTSIGVRWNRAEVSAKHNGAGELLALDEASKRGAREWASAAEAARRLGIEIEFVGGPRDSQRERLDSPD